MKKYRLLAAFIALSCSTSAQDGFSIPTQNQRGPLGPDWGPYSNRYAGIAHIADSSRGLRFDFSIFLAQYRGNIVVPNARFESDWYPWNASPDLNYFSFREELEWKDKVFADVSFVKLDDRRRLMKMIITNNLPSAQSLAMHFMAGLIYGDALPARVNLPAGRKWISAIDYNRMDYARPRPDDNLITDGLLKGEVRNSDFVGGSGLGLGFGEVGDKVSYDITVDNNMSDGVLLIRYKLPAGKTALFKSEGLLGGEIELTGTGTFATKTIKTGLVNKGRHPLTLTALSNTLLELDGFCLLEEKEVASVEFETPVKKPVPITEQPYKKTVLLKYADVSQYYGIAWSDNTAYKLREIFTDELDNAVRTIAGDNIYLHHYNRRDAHTTNIFLRAIQLAAASTKTFYAVLAQGSREEVLESMKSFPALETMEAAFKKYTDTTAWKANPAGRKYAFSNHLLQATALQNIVYPVYTQRQFTRQFVPGKRWSSLYTWDNGFTGIGMANVDVQRAIESLQVYTTDSASTNAYTHHGSPVPIQFFLYKEIWDKALSKDLLSYFYPRLKKYYQFFCGNYGSSTTRKLSSGLLSTFDYFYNSGGWDDYPAQEHMHAKRLAGVTAPAISSSMAIRMAKIMSHAAAVLNLKNDVADYQKDITFFTAALQQYSWDEASGYFGYVVHDKTTGKPAGILRTEEGINFNMGLDGIYPLVAGICTPAQRSAALKNLFSNKACWTDIGISAVDQSAPYFSLEGYWNGAVWFPHQWVFWKTMLDEGEGERAAQIAITALDLYSKEADSTYYTAEIFRIDTKRGNGWKQFGALSSPILSWYSAYFQPGSITTGFDTWVMQKKVSTNKEKLTATLQLTAKDKRPVVLVCMPQGKAYRVKLNSKTWAFTEKLPGALQIVLPADGKNTIELVIEPKD